MELLNNINRANIVMSTGQKYALRSFCERIHAGKWNLKNRNAQYKYLSWINNIIILYISISHSTTNVKWLQFQSYIITMKLIYSEFI